MGYGTIDSPIDFPTAEGEYTIDLDYGSEVINQRIIAISAKQAELEVSIAAQNAVYLVELGELNSLLAYQNNAMIDYINAPPDEKADKLNTLNYATKAVIEQKGRTQKQKSKGDFYKLQLASGNAELARLQALVLTETRDVWCVDYTVAIDDGTEVGTIEISGEQPTILIAPGGERNIAADGEFISRETLSAEAVYLNSAILPGWQKFSPTYRLGQITSIDRDNDQCEVTLDAAESSAQALDINQEQYLSEVPIEYMTCNSRPFSVWDRVVVKFSNQDWQQPKVIGFESEPKPCSIIDVRYVAPRTSNDGDLWIFNMDAGQALLDALRLMTNPPASAQTFYPVYIQARPDGDTEWVTLPFYETISHDPAAAFPYWVSDGQAGYEPVVWSADGKYDGNHQSRRLFQFVDCTTDHVDWTTFQFSQVWYMAEATSVGQTTTPLYMEVIGDQFRRYVGIDPKFDNFDADIIEMKVRTRVTPLAPGVAEGTLAHFTIKHSTTQIFGHRDIDLIPYNVGGVYGASKTPTELTGYDFPPG